MGHSLHDPHTSWARLRVDVNCGLRRGAWYPIVQFAQDRAVLEVTGDRVPVRRRLLQTSFSRPSLWSIVPLPDDAVNVPSVWGTRYLVCPNCQARSPIGGYRPDLPCPQCARVFRIAWDEHYLRRRE